MPDSAGGRGGGGGEEVRRKGMSSVRNIVWCQWSMVDCTGSNFYCLLSRDKACANDLLHGNLHICAAGAKLTVRQACYVLLSQKRSLRQKDTAFDQQMRLLRDVFLPEGNLLPPSLHLVEKVAGCRVPDDYSFHVCPCDRHSWDNIPKASWPLHSEDDCPACGLSRFVRSVDTGLPIKPRKVNQKLHIEALNSGRVICRTTEECDNMLHQYVNAPVQGKRPLSAATDLSQHSKASTHTAGPMHVTALQR